VAEEPAPPEARAESSVSTRPRRPPVRLLWTVILLLAVGAGLLYLSSKLTWNWSRHPTALRGLVVDAQDGATAQPALVPLALLALAGIAAVFAIGGWWRRIIGGLLALAGLATVWAGTSGLSGLTSAHPVGYPASQVAIAHGLVLFAGLLVVVASVLVVRGAAVLPRLGSNYQAPGARTRPKDPDAELWRALSEGEDPTAE
jgi:uncharacterized membrane protein (TIGR02234 family)